MLPQVEADGTLVFLVDMETQMLFSDSCIIQKLPPDPLGSAPVSHEDSCNIILHQSYKTPDRAGMVIFIYIMKVLLSIFYWI